MDRRVEITNDNVCGTFGYCSGFIITRSPGIRKRLRPSGDARYDAPPPTHAAVASCGTTT
jgi:hypothetical protein